MEEMESGTVAQHAHESTTNQHGNLRKRPKTKMTPPIFQATKRRRPWEHSSSSDVSWLHPSSKKCIFGVSSGDVDGSAIHPLFAEQHEPSVDDGVWKMLTSPAAMVSMLATLRGGVDDVDMKPSSSPVKTGGGGHVKTGGDVEMKPSSSSVETGGDVEMKPSSSSVETGGDGVNGVGDVDGDDDVPMDPVALGVQAAPLIAQRKKGPKPKRRRSNQEVDNTPEALESLEAKLGLQGGDMASHSLKQSVSARRKRLKNARGRAKQGKRGNPFL